MPSRSMLIWLALSAVLALPACFSGLDGPKSKTAEKTVAPPAPNRKLTAVDVDRIVRNAEQESALSLFQTASTASSSMRREDAAFLYFAAQIRARADMKIYPPVGTGGNSPGVAFSAMRHQIGTGINAAIMRDRDGYARVLARLEKWKPTYDEGYHPGWDFKEPLPDNQRAGVISGFRNTNIAGMRGMSRLFQNDEYHSLIRKIQDYNLGADFVRKIDSGRFPPTQVTEAEFEQAKRRGAEIEKQLGIEGAFSR